MCVGEVTPVATPGSSVSSEHLLGVLQRHQQVLGRKFESWGRSWQDFWLNHHLCLKRGIAPYRPNWKTNGWIRTKGNSLLLQTSTQTLRTQCELVSWTLSAWGPGGGGLVGRDGTALSSEQPPEKAASSSCFSLQYRCLPGTLRNSEFRAPETFCWDAQRGRSPTW